MSDIAEAKRLRALGLSYTDIEALLELGDSHGSRARRLVLGLGGSGKPRTGGGRSLSATVPAVRISLWKAAEGGRSFKRIEACLAMEGISCRKPSKEEGLSPFEGRYDLIVAEKDAEDARRILMCEVDGFTVQALDDLRDPTR